MEILTTREILKHSKKYFELAKTEKVVVKRGQNEYVNLIVSEKPDDVFLTQDWLNEFLAIPEQYRCNPFDVSPSGDLFFADKRNVENLKKAIEQGEKDKAEGRVKSFKTKAELTNFLNGL